MGFDRHDAGEVRPARLAGETPADVLAFAAARLQSGERLAVATLVDIVGPSARRLGAQIALALDARGGGACGGAWAGSLSGGCFDANVVALLQRTIETGAGARQRFGAGSPYVDLQLPCGGGVDLLLTPIVDPRPILEAAKAIEERRPQRLAFGEEGARAADAARAGDYVARYVPPLRLAIAGAGAEAVALARIARAAGWLVDAWTSDEVDLSALAEAGAQARLMTSAADADFDADFNADPWTAVVTLFHDHDKEPPILARALASEAFYVGAMGAKATCERRRHALAALGVAAASIARLRAPIGLVPATREPSALAISTLAEIASVDAARRA
ncbi:MAG: XdhC family protein [Parvularculaceae bacterium]